MKIKAVKGRAMLHWEGKHTIDQVGYYPPQLEEVCGVENPPEPTYDNFESGPNLVFQGDNKEILSTLLVNGFREKIDLIYIDPPFASGADYIRKVALRGKKDKLKGEEQSVAEQIQYTDIWKNDTYLQFMYERLTLMRQLLSDKGSLYLHCDPTMSHYLKLIMDEVFGIDQYRNEIVWCYAGGGVPKEDFPRKHDVILRYSREEEVTFNTEYRPYGEHNVSGQRFTDRDGTRSLDYREEGTPINDWWTDINPVINLSGENYNYTTQKPMGLIERIINISSNEGEIILDCFAGSGTTAVVAEKLGRRWIVADINKGAIQTMMKRIQKSIDKPHGIAHYRINNYDATTHLERRYIVIKKCGVQINRQDQFFDGTLDGTLVKIVDLTKPFTQLDFQQIKDELNIRSDETRNITVFCYGSETNLADAIDEWNSPPCVNNIIVREIGSEGITTFEKAQANVNFQREEHSVTITIEDYISPTICDRLDIDNTLFDEHIEDFRAQIDCVLIDTDYNGEYFNQVQSDVPENKEDFVQAKYTLPIPRPDARVAVKIIDMLGEETIKIG